MDQFFLTFSVISIQPAQQFGLKDLYIVGMVRGMLSDLRNIYADLMIGITR